MGCSGRVTTVHACRLVIGMAVGSVTTLLLHGHFVTAVTGGAAHTAATLANAAAAAPRQSHHVAIAADSAQRLAAEDCNWRPSFGGHSLESLVQRQLQQQQVQQQQQQQPCPATPDLLSADACTSAAQRGWKSLRWATNLLIRKNSALRSEGSFSMPPVRVSRQGLAHHAPRPSARSEGGVARQQSSVRIARQPCSVKIVHQQSSALLPDTSVLSLRCTNRIEAWGPTFARGCTPHLWFKCMHAPTKLYHGRALLTGFAEPS
jgi:hypothetical protein